MRNKFSYYLRVFRKASFKKFFGVVSEAHKKSGKGKIPIMFDIFKSMKKYGAGYYDYIIFEFWNLTPEQRDTYLTRFRSKKLVTLMNDPEYNHFFENKNEFNKLFKKYIGREFVDLKTASKEEIKEFYNTREKIFAKLLDQSCGIGCELLLTKDFSNFEEFYNYIREKQFGTIEDVITQHEDLAKLYPFSVNTMRMITMVDAKGVPHCLFAAFKMGNGGRVVDNYGLHSPVDLETGEILFPAHSGDTTAGILYTEHPYTHIPLLGYKVPMIKEAVKLVEEAALVVPQMRYIGWDVATTPKGPVIIEGNGDCAHDFWQLPGQTEDGYGFIPVIKKVIPEFEY